MSLASEIAENYFGLSRRFRWLSVATLVLLIAMSIWSLFLITIATGLTPRSEYFWDEIRPMRNVGIFLQSVITLCFALRVLLLIFSPTRIRWSASLWVVSIVLIFNWAFVSYLRNYDCFYSSTYYCVDASPNHFHYTTYEFQQALAFYWLASALLAVLMLLIALGQTVFRRRKVSNRTEPS
mgnify:CR=1 FL=1